MVRSPGFGSTITNLRPIQTRFRCGSGLSALTSLATVTRRTVLQKVRRYTDLRHSAPTVCKHMVSGSFSLPSRGAFHLSLAVLVRYRSLGSI